MEFFNYWYLPKLLKFYFIVPTIGLLLQIFNTRCILQTYSSTIEMRENEIWNYQTEFSKIHKLIAKEMCIISHKVTIEWNSVWAYNMPKIEHPLRGLIKRNDYILSPSSQKYRKMLKYFYFHIFHSQIWVNWLIDLIAISAISQNWKIIIYIYI
jgi:hypothetical protein